MKEKYKDGMYIDISEFQSKILNHIYSKEFDKQFESTQFSTYEDAKGYKQAMMHGMVMASIMTSQCAHFYVKKLETEEQGYIIVHQGNEDEYYEECSICHSKDVSVDDTFCSNCGVMFFGIKNENEFPSDLQSDPQESVFRYW